MAQKKIDGNFDSLEQRDGEKVVGDAKNATNTSNDKHGLKTEKVRKELENPYENANVFSKVVFWWTMQMLRKGWNTTLDIDDIPIVPKFLNSDFLADTLEKEWNGLRQIPGPYRLVKSLFRAFKLEFVAVQIICTFEDLVLRILQPVIFGYFLRYLSGKSAYTWTEGFIFVFSVCFMALLYAFLHHIHYFILMLTSIKVRVSLSALIYRKAVRLNNPSVSQVPIGQLVNFLSNDIAKFDLSILFVSYLWIAPIQLLIAGGILWSNVGPFSIIGLVILVLYIPLQSMIGRIFAKLRLKVASVTDERTRLMNEIISGIKVIKMYAWEYSFAQIVSKIRQKEFTLLRKASLYRAVNAGLFGASIRIIMLFILTGYVLHGNHNLDAEKIFVTLSLFYVVRLTTTLFFQFAITYCSEAWSSIKRLHKFFVLEEFDEAVLNRSALIPKPEMCLVSFDHVTAAWDRNDSKYALVDISMKAAPSTLTVIIGPVGAGKSALLMTILNELFIIKGSATVVGRVAYVPQESSIFNNTIKENILFGKEYDKKKYRKVLTCCALKTDLDILPYGDSTFVGDKGAVLSGGQKSRICLARAVYDDADIYVLDDPLSAVDSKVGRHLFNVCIRQCLKSKIVILVTHQLQFLEHADNILAIKKSKVIANGSYRELLNSGLELDMFVKKGDDDEDEQRDEPKCQNTTESTQSQYLSQSSCIHTTTVGSGSRLDQDADVVSVQNLQQQEVEEIRSSGTVNWNIYLHFLLAGGGFFSLFMLFITNAAAQSISVYCDLWLSHWVDSAMRYDNGGNSTSNATASDTVYDAYFYYHVFVILSVAAIVLLTSASVVNYMACIVAARNLHNEMFSHLLHSPLSFFFDNSAGRILNRFTKDIGQIDDLIPFVFNDVMSLGLLSLAIVVMVSYVNYIIVFPSVALTIIFIFVRVFYLKTLRDIKRLEGTSKSYVFTHLSSSMHGLFTIRSFRAIDRFVDRFDTLQDRNTSTSFMLIGVGRWFGQILDFLSLIFITITAMLCFFLRDSITAGETGFALVRAIQMSGMFQWCVRQSAELESHMTSVERVIEYGQLPSESPKESSSENKPPDDWPTNGSILFDDVSLKYAEDGPFVLKNLKCKINESEKIGIVGRTGAGKSSLITSLFRLFEPQGNIVIDDIVINDIGLHDLRNHISIIPQDPLLFTNTMRYNLDPFSVHSDERLWDALDQVCLKDVVEVLPGALESRLTEGGSNFSVGQKQLVCLARALLRKNKILVLDEATANVDVRTDSLIQQTIREKFANCTVLTIAHRLNTVMDSSRILVLDNGSIVEFDSPSELLKNKKSIFYGMVSEMDNETIGADEA